MAFYLVVIVAGLALTRLWLTPEMKFDALFRTSLGRMAAAARAPTEAAAIHGKKIASPRIEPINAAPTDLNLSPPSTSNSVRAPSTASCWRVRRMGKRGQGLTWQIHRTLCFQSFRG